MTRGNKKSIYAFVVGALLFLSPGAVRGAEPAEPAPLEAAAIERMARDARTPAAHLEVAKQYELRARALEVKADKMEREIRQQKAAPNAMESKWPAMVANARERRERLVMQTRRAAQECYQLAQNHRTLAGGASTDTE